MALRGRAARSRERAWGRAAPHLSRILFAVLPLFVVVGVQAGPAEGTDIVETLEASYGEALDELYAWCRRTRLNQRADEVAKELLVVDPEHEGARRWLGFQLRRGEWRPPDRPKTRKNWNRSASKKYPARRAALLGVFADDYWDAYQRLRHEESTDASKRLLQLATLHWPTDARFREAAGETRRKADWILVESARSPAMQKRLRRAASRLLEGAPAPVPCATPEVLRDLEFDCRGACRCKGITVASGTSQSEAVNVARHCVAAESLFQLVFDLETTLPTDYVVALGGGYTDTQKMVTQLRLPAHVDRQYRTLGGFYIAAHNIDFNSASDPAYKLECSVRRVMIMLIERTFGDFRRLGWPGEGMAAYLTWLICRTHLVCYSMLAGRTEQSARGREKEEAPVYGWLTAARRLASEDRLPELIYIVAVDTNAMTRADIIGSYAFAAYLLSGQTEHVTMFLHGTSAGKETDRAARAVLGLSLPELDVRFRRWLQESY